MCLSLRFRHLESCFFIEAPGQCICMIPIKGDLSFGSEQAIPLKEFSIHLSITFTLQKVLNDTHMLVRFMGIYFGNELLNLLRVNQKVICNALPIENLHRLEEIIVIDIDVLSYYVRVLSRVHVQEASNFGVQNLQHFMLMEIVLVCVQQVGYFRFYHDVALLVILDGFAEVNIEQRSHQACPVLVVHFRIILELIEHAIFLIFI